MHACMKAQERSITDALVNHSDVLFCFVLLLSLSLFFSPCIVINCSMNTITNAQNHERFTHSLIAWIVNEIETIVLRNKGFNVEIKWINFNFHEISFRFSFFFFCIKIFYVRAPSQYMTPSGVGTIKLTYTSNQAQPQTSVQYASTTPKVNLNISLDQRVWNENEMLKI